MHQSLNYFLVLRWAPEKLELDSQSHWFNRGITKATGGKWGRYPPMKLALPLSDYSVTSHPQRNWSSSKTGAGTKWYINKHYITMSRWYIQVFSRDCRVRDLKLLSFALKPDTAASTGLYFWKDLKAICGRLIWYGVTSCTSKDSERKISHLLPELTHQYNTT